MADRVALFGGSFNPPHIGHAQVVLTLLHQGFDEVWALPAGVHPFGKELAPFSLRARMLSLALSDFGPRVRICTVEAELAGPSRTFDTVTELIRRHPAIRFTLALGEDQRDDLPRWHRIDELRELAPFVFVGRGTWTPGQTAVRIPDYSSSEIRRRISSGQFPSELLHTRVSEFIKARGLYGAPVTASDPPPRVAIIGLGRVGGSLLATLCAAGLPPLWCADPDPARTAGARSRAVPVFEDWAQGYRASPDVDFLLFCTPDRWRPQARPDFWTTSPICLHTGGMHRPSELFADLAIPEERMGILHPARAVASRDTCLTGSLFSVTGCQTVITRMIPLLELLQATPVPVAQDDRMAFHAICSLVANGSQVLEQRAAELLARLGSAQSVIPELVRQLVGHGLEAWVLLGREGLTGPWTRGDKETISGHLETLTRLDTGSARLYGELKREAGRVLARAPSTAAPEHPDTGGGPGLGEGNPSE